MQGLKNLSRRVQIIISVVIGTVLTFVIYYMTLPPLNPCSRQFWIFILFVALFYGVPLGLFRLTLVRSMTGIRPHFQHVSKVFVVILLIPVVVLIIGSVISSTFFNAHRYASIISVTEADFSEDMPETNTVTNISLMDSSSARILGNRALGALSDVVSQFTMSSDCNQINYKGSPEKVMNLEYADFFKWMSNRSSGIPGYIMVDPVNSKAEYVELSESLKYVESGRFSDDLMRKLRFSYPTKIFDSVNFEIDEEENPWFIVSCVSPKVGLFGGMDVKYVIIFNPCDGSSTLYNVGDVPSWVDNVYDGYLAADKYDWYGTLSGGFWNSVVGNKNCRKTTDDFGYIVLGDDVWYYTGVTSLVSDESNIGFIISNARTGEYKYYPVVGAEEYSAMSAAEGEVQEKGYTASFPSLINVSGQATYIMVLKDDGGLVKLYALVNVENYSIVATGTTQTEAKQTYLNLLVQRGIVDKSDAGTDDMESAEVITVMKLQTAVIGSTTYLYITDGDGNVYRGDIGQDETLMMIDVGEKVSVIYTVSDNGIRVLTRFQVKTAGTDES